MRKMLFIALMSLIGLSAYARGKQPITFERLPKTVQDAVLAVYPQNEVILITSQKTLPRQYRYTFNMADGTKVSYTHKAQLHEVENIKGIKDAYVPEKVLEYVHNTFPNATITEYKFEYGVHKAELNNAMTLLFSKSGKFLRIDD